MLTNAVDPDARLELLDALDDSNRDKSAHGSMPLKCGDVAMAIFNGMLTQEVWQKDHLPGFGVPILRPDDNILKRCQWYAKNGEREERLFRYQWREFRRTFLETREFDSQVASLADDIMARFEKGMVYILPDEPETFPPGAMRESLIESIQRAIRLKCRMELSSTKYEIQWPATIQGRFDGALMETKIVDPRNTDQPVTSLHHHRIRMPLCQLIIQRRPPGLNEDGLEAFERERLIATLSPDELGDRGFRPPEVLQRAKVVLFEGSIAQATD